MFDTNLEKAKLESEMEMQKLKIQIATLNTEAAKQSTNLSQTSSAAENVETMLETVRVTEQRLEEKVKEVL